jgi:hypothetical protein
MGTGLGGHHPFRLEHEKIKSEFPVDSSFFNPADLAFDLWAQGSAAGDRQTR